MAGRSRPRRRGLVALSSAAGLLVVGWLAPMPWLAGVHLEQSLTRWPDGFDWGAAGARLVDAS